MNVLIVGGTGNISTSIVAELLRQGHAVSVVTRGGHRDELPPEVTRIVADRRDYGAFEATMADHAWDAVIDMVAFTADDAESAVRAFTGRTDHYVVCSTVVTYGDRFTQLPADEDEPQTATDAYGRGKVEMEQIVREAHATGRLPVTIMRPSHTFGRIPIIRQVTGLDTTFIDRLRLGRPILVTDTAEDTTWMSLHVDDAAVAFVHCLGRDVCIGNVYNVVGDETYSWADYHRRIAGAIDLKAELVAAPVDVLLAAGGAQTAILGITAFDGWFSNNRIKGDVPEFAQRISFEDGMRRNVAYADAHGLITSAQSATWEDNLIEELTR